MQHNHFWVEIRYKFPQPTLIYERQENGVDPLMGAILYVYVRIQLEFEENVSDQDTYVIDPMGGYKTMALWKTQNLFTEEPTINDGNILGLKESITGFTLNLSKLNLVLALSGEPLNTAIPRDVALQMQLIKMHFDNRLDRMTTLSADGSLDF
jgi:hypothetical protein